MPVKSRLFFVTADPHASLSNSAILGRAATCARYRHSPPISAVVVPRWTAIVRPKIHPECHLMWWGFSLSNYSSTIPLPTPPTATTTSYLRNIVWA